ncbi:MAG: sugar phosphate isomerase/epimerase [Fervidobacterium sp.]
MRRKVISTSLIRANIEKLNDLPVSKHYELTFFKENDLSKILEFLHAKNAAFGLHAPFIYRYKQVHPFPTSTIDELRKDTYEKNCNCAILGKNIGARYVVIHFPNAQQSENWIAEQKIVYEATEVIFRLNQIIPVRIENVYMNDYFHSPEDYTCFVKQTNTTLCIDIGHLLIDSEIYNFDPVEFVDKCAEYISEFHLYYADLEIYNQCHHAPWGNSKNFLRLLDFIKDFECDFTVEASNDCNDGLDKLLSYVEEVTKHGDGNIRI